MSLLLHPTTQARIELLTKDLPQAILLTGLDGVGVSSIADYIAESVGSVILKVVPEKNDKIDIEKGTISVESIRRLYSQTRTIQTGKMVIVIDYAERMAATAQNAFLKLLEEPGKNIHFILATHTPSTLLPTVLSRTQRIDVQPITLEQSNELLDLLKVSSTQKRTQILYVAEGLPAEISRLATNSVYFESKVAIVRDARDLLQAPLYKKLVIANKYKDDKNNALLLIKTAENIIKKNIYEKPTRRAIRQIDTLLSAYQHIQANGNIRLNLARLVI